MLATLRECVEIESPSSDKSAVNRLVAYLAERFTAAGGGVSLHSSADFGDHLQADFRFPGGTPPGGRLLVLGHTDTVWPVGTLQPMPFRIAGKRAQGPGIFDMKAGIVEALYAIEALREAGTKMRKQVTVLLVSDEEVGSGSSRAITEKLASQCDAVLVVEPAAGPKGALKTARKGCGCYRIEVQGKAAHAGLDFTSGVNAIVELARQLTRISHFTRLKRGITVNVGTIAGGTRENVVPAEARAEVNVRVARLADRAYLEKQFGSLKPFDPKTRLQVKGGIDRPPLERTAAVAALFEHARRLARPLGINLTETSVGGGSDGNFTAALGIPTLDGLGAVGDGAHAAHEHILVDELPKRTALLAHLIATL